MGNTSSNVTSGVKRQAESSAGTLYGLVDLKGNTTTKVNKEVMDNIGSLL